MTIETSTRDDDELVISTEFSKSVMDLHFAHSWNCTEVFLNNVVHGVMGNLDDVRCDNDISCSTEDILNGQGKGKILDDLQNLTESRQEPPLPSTYQNGLPAIKEKYSIDSINSILVDSFDELNDLKPITEDREVDESVQNRSNTETLVVQASKVSVAEEGHEMKRDSIESDTCGDELDGLILIVEDESAHDDSKETLVVQASKIFAAEEICKMKCDSTSVTPDIIQSLDSVPILQPTNTSEVADTEVAVNSNKDQKTTTVEDILQLNDDVRYEDVVSLIENSFLPSEAVAKAVRFDDAYFDDNAVERRGGREKFRCSLLPFLC